jgi:hypothetical protein
MHEARLRRKGTAAPTRYSEAPLAERWARWVTKGEGCWLWQGNLNNNGYGTITVETDGHRRSRRAYAHRVSYELHVGAIPAGMCVLHSCDNPQCVNPDHLSVGTQSESMLQMFARGRKPSTSVDRIREIAMRRQAGASVRLLAAEFCLSKSQIRRLLDRATKESLI